MRTKLSEYEEDNNKISKRIEELEVIVTPQKILIEELTIELCNSKKMVNDLGKNLTKYIEYKNGNEIITGKLGILK